MENRKPNIICAGMLDTKADEIKFLGAKVREFGGNPIFMDLSLGAEADWADIKLGEVLAVNGTKKEEVFQAARSEACPIVGKAGAIKIMEMYEQGLVDGIISWAGTMGTSTVTYVMRALPIGVPKVMLCTSASCDVSSWLGSKDIYIANPISEKGVNAVTKKTVVSAAAGVVAMANAVLNEKNTKCERKLAAVTLYGTTTPAAVHCAEHMEKQDWDTIYIHQNGTGSVMEDMIRSGDIHAVFDLTPAEFVNTQFHSIFGVPEDWPGTRLTAAFDMGIPNVSAPGGMDQIAYGPIDSVPASVMEDFATGKRLDFQGTKRPYCHNSAVTILVPTLEETADFGHYIMEKMNKAKGPSVFLMPMRGWSAYDQSIEHACAEMGWGNPGATPSWIADKENPQWSQRATTLWNAMEKEWDQSNENVDLICCDLHILDPEFAVLACEIMDDILAGTWKKGSHRSAPYILK